MSILDLSMVPAPVVKAAPKIRGIRPTGSLVLVEFMTAQEISGSSIVIGEDVKLDGPPQGRVLDVGPGLPETAGISVGARVIVQGRGVGPLPDYDGKNRERMLVEYSMIKGIVDEVTTDEPKVHRCCQSN